MSTHALRPSTFLGIVPAVSCKSPFEKHANFATFSNSDYGLLIVKAAKVVLTITGTLRTHPHTVRYSEERVGAEWKHDWAGIYDVRLIDRVSGDEQGNCRRGHGWIYFPLPLYPLAFLSHARPQPVGHGTVNLSRQARSSLAPGCSFSGICDRAGTPACVPCNHRDSRCSASSPYRAREIQRPAECAGESVDGKTSGEKYPCFLSLRRLL